MKTASLADRKLNLFNRGPLFLHFSFHILTIISLAYYGSRRNDEYINLNYSVVQFARLHLKYVEKRMENRSLFHSKEHVRSLRKLNSNF